MKRNEYYMNSEDSFSSLNVRRAWCETLLILKPLMKTLPSEIFTSILDNLETIQDSINPEDSESIRDDSKKLQEATGDLNDILYCIAQGNSSSEKRKRALDSADLVGKLSGHIERYYYESATKERL